MYVVVNVMSMIFYITFDKTHICFRTCIGVRAVKNEKASLEGMSEAFGLFAGANDH
jgi:hypothetical protein